MDTVRGVQFVQGSNCLVSASEDTTIRLWDIDQFCKQDVGEGNIEAYYTMRGHASPILSLTGQGMKVNGGSEPIIASGSSDGAIKIWQAPPRKAVEPFGKSIDHQFMIASWELAHDNEPVWDLRLNTAENLLISVGSDFSVGLWQVPQHPQSYI